MNDNYAVIIGINDYTPQKQSGLKTLCGAIKDAEAFEKWVKDVDGGNVDKANCFKITSTPNPLKPIQDEIDDAFAKMISQIKNNGGKAKRLYFYFAGHGLGSYENISDTALCLANWSELKRNNALSSEAYKETIRQFGFFEEIIFFADCCRNTKINIKPMHPTFALPIPDPDAGKTKLFIGYATLYQDQSFEIEVEDGSSEMRGVFTKVLIEGLKGAAAKGGIINADSLRDYLLMQTPVEALKHGFKQKPEIVHSFTSSTPLITVTDTDINCTITFSAARNSDVELFNNSGLINTFDATNQKSIKISLTKGLYLLRDTVTDEEYPFHASPVKKEISINF